MTSLRHNQHRVHSLALHVGVPSQDAARQVQMQISAWTEHRLPQLLLHAVSGFDQGNFVVRIDRVVVDLGDVEIDDLEDELAERLPALLEASVGGGVATARLAEPATDRLGQRKQQTLSERFPPDASTETEVGNAGSEQVPLREAILEQLRTFWLTGEIPWNGAESPLREMDQTVLELLREARHELRQVMREVAGSPTGRRRLVANLQESTLETLGRELFPITRQQLRAVAGLMMQIGRQLAEFFPQLDRAAWESEMLLAGLAAPERDFAAVARKCVETALQTSFQMSGDQPLTEATRSLIAQRIEAEIARSGIPGNSATHLPTLARLADPSATETTSEQPSPDNQAAARFVRNAGLAVLWPYLAKYFATLNLVADGKFVSPEHRRQAVHELEFLVRDDGEYREFDLVFNKVLCGVALRDPVGCEAQPLDPREAESLLQQAIRNWKILGKTSIDGFRKSFLNRDGKLIEEESAWKLVIDRRGYDVLVERIPYAMHAIKLPWMDKPLYVEW